MLADSVAYRGRSESVYAQQIIPTSDGQNLSIEELHYQSDATKKFEKTSSTENAIISF